MGNTSGANFNPEPKLKNEELKSNSSQKIKTHRKYSLEVSNDQID